MGLRQSIHEDPVSSLPLRELIKVLPSSTVRQAIEKMKDRGLGCVIVVDEYDRPLGKFTERVIIHKLAQPGFLDSPVIDHVVSAEPGCVKIDQPVEAVFRYMNETGLRFVCVTDAAGKKMVGLTGQKGVMEYLAEHFPRAIKGHQIESKLFIDEREGA